MTKDLAASVGYAALSLDARGDRAAARAVARRLRVRAARASRSPLHSPRQPSPTRSSVRRHPRCDVARTPPEHFALGSRAELSYSVENRSNRAAPHRRSSRRRRARCASKRTSSSPTSRRKAAQGSKRPVMPRHARSRRNSARCTSGTKTRSDLSGAAGSHSRAADDPRLPRPRGGRALRQTAPAQPHDRSGAAPHEAARHRNRVRVAARVERRRRVP